MKLTKKCVGCYEIELNNEIKLVFHRDNFTGGLWEVEGRSKDSKGVNHHIDITKRNKGFKSKGTALNHVKNNKQYYLDAVMAYLNKH